MEMGFGNVVRAEILKLIKLPKLLLKKLPKLQWPKLELAEPRKLL
jgi:hypothetical protein